MPSNKPAATVDLESLITFRISKLHSRLALWTARDQLDKFDLALREWRVLALLARHEPMTASDLVQRSPLDKGSVSRAVANLIERGLIRARNHPNDARSRELALTPKGWSLYRKVAPKSQIRHDSVLSALSQAEQEAFFATLAKLQQQVDRLFPDDEDGSG